MTRCTALGRQSASPSVTPVLLLHTAWLDGDNGLRKQVELINEQFAN
eukprot:COSAG01_NODE_47496_length_389_cov_3.268966_1_plen_46_part_10